MIRRTLTALTLLASAVMPLSAQDAPAADAMPDLAQSTAIVKSLLNRAVEEELAILQEITELSDEAIAGMRLGVTPLIAKSARNLSKSQDIRFAGSLSMPPQMMDAIAAAARTVVTDKDRLAMYLEDVQVRREFSIRTNATAFLATLDNLVGLTSAQMADVSRVARKLSADGKLGDATNVMLGQAGLSIKSEELAGVLTKQQLKHYERFNAYRPMAFLGNFGKQEQSEDDRRAELADTLRAVASMKIDQLEAELKLSASQRRRLELVSKKVVAETLEQRLKAEARYREWARGIQGGNAGNEIDPQTVDTVQASPVHLFEADESWDRFVRSTLSDDQNQAWQKSTGSRMERGQRVVGLLLVTAFKRELTLNGRQIKALHNLLSKHVGPRRSATFNPITGMQSFAAIVDIPENDYVAAIGRDNWQKFEPILAQLRQQIEMRKAQQHPQQDEDE